MADSKLPAWLAGIGGFFAEAIVEIILEYFFLWRRHGAPVLAPVAPAGDKGKKDEKEPAPAKLASRVRDAAREFEERRTWLMLQLWGTESYPRLQDRYLAALANKAEEELELALLILTSPLDQNKWTEGLRVLEGIADDRKFAAAIDTLTKESVVQRILKKIPGGERYVTRQVIAARRATRSITSTWWGRVLGGPNAGILRPKSNNRRPR